MFSNDTSLSPSNLHEETSHDKEHHQTNQLTFSNDCHPISCVRCRKLHKKCDKKLSGCSKCLAVGSECVYNTPQKRGKGSEQYSLKSKEKAKTDDKKRMKGSNSDDQSSTDTMHHANGMLMKISPIAPMRVIEIYFTFLCGIHPLIEKAKLVYFVNNYLHYFERREDVELQPNEWIKSKGELRCIYAFYLGVLTLSSQLLGELEYVDYVLRKAECEIAALSVDYVTEFYWGGSCHLMFMACVAEGNQLKSNYYHTLINFYLENETKLRDDKFYKSLLHHKTLVSARFMKELNTMENLLDNMYQLFFYSVNKKLDDFLLPGTWEYMKTTKITSQNYVLFKQVSHFIFRALMKHKTESMKALTDCHSDSYFKHQRLFTTILSEGYAFLFLKQIQEVSYTLMEESALRITLLTENDLFPYCLFAVLSAVVEACSFHLNNCKMVERGLKPRKSSILTSSGQTITFDSFSILEKDLRAITILSKRYRRAKTMHQSLIDEMTQVINRNSLHDVSPLSLIRDNLSTMLPSQGEDVPIQNDEVLMSILRQLTQEEEPTQPMNEVTDEALTTWDEIFAEAIPSSIMLDR